MPFYEFYCSCCNTIFTFFSKTVNTEKRPPCPKCQKDCMSRMVSRFAVTGKAQKGGSGDGEGSDGMPDFPIDEAKMERAMETLASEAENMNEEDPRQAAQLMRKLTDMTGLRLGDKMEEALSRMESGEDPDAIEQQMGDMDENDLFKLDDKGAGSKSSRKRSAPARDETLYDM
jgi:putative FmdB family regulatory protein